METYQFTSDDIISLEFQNKMKSNYTIHYINFVFDVVVDKSNIIFDNFEYFYYNKHRIE